MNRRRPITIRNMRDHLAAWIVQTANTLAAQIRPKR